MTWLWDKAAGWIVGVGAILAAIGGIWFKAKAEGRASEREAEARHKAEAIANKRKLDDEIDGLAPADVDSRFNRWVRKDER
jgi:hypothetical protein